MTGLVGILFVFPMCQASRANPVETSQSLFISTAALWIFSDFDKAHHNKTSDSLSVNIEEAGSIEQPGTKDSAELSLFLEKLAQSNEESASSKIFDQGIPKKADLTFQLTEAESAIIQQQANFESDLTGLSENVQDHQLQDKLSNNLASASKYRRMILQKTKAQNAIDDFNNLRDQ